MLNINFEEFKKELVLICNYYDVPLNSFVVAGNNAKELNIQYIKNDKDLLDTERNFTKNISLFATEETSAKLRAHFTTTCKKKAIITFTLDTTNIVVFEQIEMLNIKVINNVKFLDAKTLRKFQYAVPERFKNY